MQNTYGSAFSPANSPTGANVSIYSTVYLYCTADPIQPCWVTYTPAYIDRRRLSSALINSVLPAGPYPLECSKTVGRTQDIWLMLK